jgi:hypothetical protein
VLGFVSVTFDEVGLFCLDGMDGLLALLDYFGLFNSPL